MQGPCKTTPDVYIDGASMEDRQNTRINTLVFEQTIEYTETSEVDETHTVSVKLQSNISLHNIV